MPRSPKTAASSSKARKPAAAAPAPNLQAAAAPEPNLAAAVRLVLELMAIPGASGEEAAVAAFIRDRLVAAGAPPSAIRHDKAHRQSPYGGGTGNLVLSLPSRLKQPRRLLTAHLDTVPLCVGAKPKRQGDVVRSADPATGLGADNRAGAAVIMHAALEILARGLPHPPLTFCWFVQEEVGLQGSRAVDLKLLGAPALGFNWDGGDAAKVTLGATGAYRLEIDITGRASHAGGAPEKGVSAIAIAALAIADLHQRGWHGLIDKDGRRGTSNVGVIQGGSATNVVTNRVRARAEARSHDPAFRQQILREIEGAFRRAAGEVRSVDGVCGSVEIQSRLDYESFALAPTSPAVEAAAAAARAVGLRPELAIANGGLDANWLTAHGVPTVTLGCGQRNVHTTDEELDIAQFQNACRVALRLATAT